MSKNIKHFQKNILKKSVFIFVPFFYFYPLTVVAQTSLERANYNLQREDVQIKQQQLQMQKDIRRSELNEQCNSWMRRLSDLYIERDRRKQRAAEDDRKVIDLDLEIKNLEGQIRIQCNPDEFEDSIRFKPRENEKLEEKLEELNKDRTR